MHTDEKLPKADSKIVLIGTFLKTFFKKVFEVVKIQIFIFVDMGRKRDQIPLEISLASLSREFVGKEKN